MPFQINHKLLTQARDSLFKRNKLYWIVGGAGSGKTTICKALSARFDIPVYDMDAHIYGGYNGRFTQTRHPVNKAWSTAPNGLAWLLNMSWEVFHNFNQAALPEYLNLLAEDLVSTTPDTSLLIDGGIINPALVAQAIPFQQIICIARPARSSVEIWEENDDRKMMKEMIYQLPSPDEMWRNFLEFDRQIRETIRKECQENNIPICSRSETDSINDFAEQVAHALRIQQR